MSSSQSEQSEYALRTNKATAERYYGIALPALGGRMDEINRALATGEPEYMRSAFQGQRGALAEGLAQKAGVASAQQAAGSKAALSGGNFGLANAADPAAFGAQLANALWGSRFAEGQANLDQQFNLMSMALGGAGTAGSGALGAAQNQLGAIGYLPRYNTTYANVVGGLAGAGALYGAFNQPSALATAPGWSAYQQAAYGPATYMSGTPSWLSGGGGAP